jgi:hypothetical protein
MPSIVIRSGARYTVRAWGNEGSCQIIDVLEDLEKNANPDAGAIWRLLTDAANSGPSRNKEKCRPLLGKKGKGLYEFKARGGTRVVWFYDGNQIICTQCFKKGHSLSSIIKTAQAIRQRYLQGE